MRRCRAAAQTEIKTGTLSLHEGNLPVCLSYLGDKFCSKLVVSMPGCCAEQRVNGEAAVVEIEAGFH